MRKFPIVVIAVAALATAAAATTTTWASSLGRPCTTAPQSRWLPLATLQAKVEALGYTVQKAKISKACGELYTTDKTGARVELFVDPTSGEIVGRL